MEQTKSLPVEGTDPDLASFREQWKKELLGESNKGAGGVGGAAAAAEQEEKAAREEQKGDEVAGGGELVEDVKQKQARELFLQGVHLEQTGRLYEAVRFYKRAVLLVPDIEYRAFQYTAGAAADRRRRGGENDNEAAAREAAAGGPAATDENGNEKGDEAEEDPEVGNLGLKFARMRTGTGGPAIQPASPTQLTHIGQLPSEVLNYILKWVVSSELDVKSLEACSQVSRGFYVAARDEEIWRLICLKVWGASVTTTNYHVQPWRDLFISRPRVNFNGCYSSKISYIREGERGFQDHESYKSWHIVKYFRFLRLFPGGRAAMCISADDPGLTAKLINNSLFCSVQGSMLGDYRIVDNVLVCVLHKQAAKKILQPRQRKKKGDVVAYYDVPQQDFHMEFYIKGAQNKVLQWKNYNIVSTFKSGREQVDSVNIGDINNFPSLTFHRVGSYHFESSYPLRL